MNKGNIISQKPETLRERLICLAPGSSLTVPNSAYKVNCVRGVVFRLNRKMKAKVYVVSEKEVNGCKITRLS